MTISDLDRSPLVAKDAFYLLLFLLSLSLLSRSEVRQLNLLRASIEMLVGNFPRLSRLISPLGLLGCASLDHAVKHVLRLFVTNLGLADLTLILDNKIELIWTLNGPSRPIILVEFDLVSSFVSYQCHFEYRLHFYSNI